MSINELLLDSHDLGMANRVVGESRHVGRVPVSLAVLAEVLSLPRGTRVLYVRMADNPLMCELVVENAALPLVQPGDAIRTLSVSYESRTQQQITKSEFV